MIRLRACLLVASIVVPALLFGCGPPGADSVMPPDASDGFDAAKHGGDGDAETGAAAPDAGYDDGGSCSPGSLASFMPVYNLPVGPYLGACSTKQLSDAVADCWAPSASASKCSAWVDDKDNAGCLGCWAGPVTSSTWAPMLYAENGGQEFIVDYGGCIQLADPSQLACARYVEYATECEIAACLAACPIPASGTTTAIDNCSQEAASGGCASYFSMVDGMDASACQSPDSTSNPAGFCMGATTPGASTEDADDLLRFFTLSCGYAPDVASPPPPGDAGSADAPH
jgi:hypothetical protein